ncbi:MULTISPECIES: DUF1844 domain-containing protein [Thermodesulfobacterium]|jgi:hypothetical protein|uniref:DUF1844 domain-containing protein n=2 Tax=Thermodesulfobacterium commune TaxID=1741 RepID=A0A075WQ49_9BACT|nr:MULTISPECIES: DUF1844 domain-containing protein [Thermodesulfobacterium]KUJ97432.1 MAG: Uncharacterized protein XD42_0925 [Thermodesulfobacterium sp. 37_54]KUK19190.1 MAG: Uncharacterized protein XD55_0742 [Thermodesulfobacterium commune]AIH03469.1 hypothetical protein HL41_00720 [Thermodesulfobacterium commune DSM 2178]KUK38368.1 MAG: Uncharacterized protein XD67_0297 [Thermodesulfobacterium commune]MBZ4681071.1 hypothetical protein [Thermodesulfobacterium sp.]
MGKEQDDLFSNLITFSTFILSLNTAALIHLGELPNPLTNKKEVNLLLAKQTIDTIEMLKEKTKGNLTLDEERLINAILYELKLKFLKVSD